MSHNPSRNPFRRTALGLDDQEAVDEYKARSIWGKWWSLSEETRRRYCNDDERRWIRRYGAKLDEIACLISALRTERKKHFLEVCEGRADPSNERERLWLRVQIICRFPEVAERSARADLAEHRNAALEAEILQLRRDLRDSESCVMEILEEPRMNGGHFDTRRRRSVCNVA